MDETFKKLLNPQDARGGRGRFSRGNNVYRGGLPSPTSRGTDSKTGIKAQNADFWSRLAQLRMKGII